MVTAKRRYHSRMSSVITAACGEQAAEAATKNGRQAKKRA
jgi:hypothetical protein